MTETKKDTKVKFSWGESAVRVPTVDDLGRLNIDDKVINEVMGLIDEVQNTKEGSDNKKLLTTLLPKLPQVAPGLIKTAIPVICSNPPKNAGDANLFDIIKVVKMLMEDKEISDFIESLSEEDHLTESDEA